MIDCGSLEYAHARLHARHGERLDESAWRRLELVREFTPLLELARGTGLRVWLAGLGADSSAQQIESSLRGQWRALVQELAGWMPGAWQPALRWCALLPDLAPLQHLARNGEPPDWMRDDDSWREFCAVEPAARGALLRSSGFAPLQDAWAQPNTLGAAWQREWRRRLPRRAAGTMLEALASALRAHAAAFEAAAPGQGWQLRAALHARLSLLLRRAALDPAAAFVHLALCALDLERLRGELLRRRLFPRWKVA